MSIEQKINYQLNKHPGVKKVVKRLYQRSMYTLSHKIKCEGSITRISPDDNSHEYFFGYYDKSPWDASDRYMLCMRANNTWSDVSPKEKADILIIDTGLPENAPDRVRKVAETSAWNVQQACMLQWMGPDFSSKIIFNDYRDGKYVAVIKEPESGSEKIIDAPVYTVSADGKTALTLDFSRLFNLRPGYGYYNVPESTKGIPLPDATAIWKIDLETGAVSELLSYKDFATFQPRSEMKEEGAVHKVNHLMLSPSGKRCMVLYRWFVGARKYTRLVTFDALDGKNMYVLSDDDMVSHCFWKDDGTILAYENKKDGGPGYYLMKDKTQEYFHCWKQLTNDGHPSYSPDRSLIVTDTYPDRARIAELKLMDGTDESKDGVKVIARVFAPFKYDNDTRCDLHPRWNRSGDKICFDSVFEGHRGLYIVDVNATEQKKIKVCFMMTACKKSGPVQQMLNIIKNLDTNVFEPVLLTIYPEPEDGTSQLEKYLPYVKHYYAPTGKLNVITGRTGAIKEVLSEIKPDVIHSLGVFPDYAVSRIKKYRQIITLRNYVWEDYPAKFGKAQGTMLAKMHLYAMKHTAKTVACSESLSKIYKEKLGLSYDFIRNGVDVDQYKKPEAGEAAQIRKELGLPENAFIYIYSGQVIDRKNQRFLLEAFRDTFKDENVYLLLLGDGADYKTLYDEFGSIKNIDFRGSVNNVNQYLKACDAYVSTSKSEGMPNGVLEAMATGLPVVLSDIEQHKEVVNAAPGIGFMYKQGDKADLAEKMKKIATEDHKKMGEAAFDSAHENFSASGMSRKYQEIYKNLVK
ncbi:MAG: glycosyltransferase [Clostridia bacterium]|nr:glycosyltransferase [Clostridia bacterium]